VEVFDGLRRVGWDGYVTVHQSLLPGEDVRASAAMHMAAVRRFLGGDGR
jgi:hypothetical protein